MPTSSISIEINISAIGLITTDYMLHRPLSQRLLDVAMLMSDNDFDLLMRCLETLREQRRLGERDSSDFAHLLSTWIANA